MDIVNSHVVYESEFGEHPDTYECIVLCDGERTDQEIVDYVIDNEFCCCGARVVSRDASGALVRFCA